MSRLGGSRILDPCICESRRLLAGGYPRPGTLEALLDASVTAFVDLTQPGEIEPYGAALARLPELRDAIGRRDPSPEMPEQRALVERWR